LRPIGAAATVLQGPDINKGTYIQNFQSTMSLIVIDFIFLEGRIMKLWLKSLQLPTLVVIGSHHVFKIPYFWEECLTLELITLLTTDVTGMMAMFYIQS
jgi:hypothetical protein